MHKFHVQQFKNSLILQFSAFVQFRTPRCQALTKIPNTLYIIPHRTCELHDKHFPFFISVLNIPNQLLNCNIRIPLLKTLHVVIFKSDIQLILYKKKKKSVCGHFQKRYTANTVQIIKKNIINKNT